MIAGVAAVLVGFIFDGERTAGVSLDFNRSTQHLDSSYREEDVADEAKTENLLHRITKSTDVGSLAERRYSRRDSAPF